MPEYIVSVMEVHRQDVQLQADSPEYAVMKVREGEGDFDAVAQYSYTLDPETWTVREVPETWIVREV